MLRYEPVEVVLVHISTQPETFCQSVKLISNAHQSSVSRVYYFPQKMLTLSLKCGRMQARKHTILLGQGRTLLLIVRFNRNPSFAVNSDPPVRDRVSTVARREPEAQAVLKGSSVAVPPAVHSFPRQNVLILRLDATVHSRPLQLTSRDVQHGKCFREERAGAQRHNGDCRAAVAPLRSYRRRRPLSRAW